MSTATRIEWTEVTWNPTTGCGRISPGCDNCYALTPAKRLKAMGQAKYQRDGDPRTSGPGFGVTVQVRQQLVERLRAHRRAQRLADQVDQQEITAPRLPRQLLGRHSAAFSLSAAPGARSCQPARGMSMPLGDEPAQCCPAGILE